MPSVVENLWAAGTWRTYFLLLTRFLVPLLLVNIVVSGRILTLCDQKKIVVSGLEEN
jgi:hypothetical protein